MLLKNLIKKIPFNKRNISVKGISSNSNSTKKNYIFFAIKGKKNDGNKFVQEALKRKASIAVVNKIQKNLGLNFVYVLYF